MSNIADEKDFLSPLCLAKTDLISRLNYYMELAVGGHFPATEQAPLIPNEIFSFFHLKQQLTQLYNTQIRGIILG